MSDALIAYARGSDDFGKKLAAVGQVRLLVDVKHDPAFGMHRGDVLERVQHTTLLEKDGIIWVRSALGRPMYLKPGEWEEA